MMCFLIGLLIILNTDHELLGEKDGRGKRHEDRPSDLDPSLSPNFHFVLKPRAALGPLALPSKYV